MWHYWQNTLSTMTLFQSSICIRRSNQGLTLSKPAREYEGPREAVPMFAQERVLHHAGWTTREPNGIAIRIAHQLRLLVHDVD